MRQLTASEASNDEIERQSFNLWLRKRGLSESGEVNSWSGRFVYDYPVIDGMWQGWQAALKSKQGEY